MKSLIIAVAISVLSLTSLASEQASTCDNAVETAYKFIEKAVKIKPAIAFFPVRTPTDTQLLRLSCLSGIQHGRAHNDGELRMIFDDIKARSAQKNISPEEARYIINDMALALSFKAGYLEGSSQVN